jgi:hypothetical protein
MDNKIVPLTHSSPYQAPLVGLMFSQAPTDQLADLSVSLCSSVRWFNSTAMSQGTSVDYWHSESQADTGLSRAHCQRLWKTECGIDFTMAPFFFFIVKRKMLAPPQPHTPNKDERVNHRGCYQRAAALLWSAQDCLVEWVCARRKMKRAAVTPRPVGRGREGGYKDWIHGKLWVYCKEKHRNKTY